MARIHRARPGRARAAVDRVVCFGFLVRFKSRSLIRADTQRKRAWLKIMANSWSGPVCQPTAQVSLVWADGGQRGVWLISELFYQIEYTSWRPPFANQSIDRSIKESPSQNGTMIQQSSSSSCDVTRIIAKSLTLNQKQEQKQKCQRHRETKSKGRLQTFRL